MKNKNTIYIVLAVIALAILTLAFSPSQEQGAKANTEYFRIHIVANSNSTLDQNVKYEIRDKVSTFLTPHLVNVNDKQAAIKKLRELSNQIEGIVNLHLALRGFKYSADVEIVNQKFPARNYLDFALEEGWYDAIKINIGDAQGDNWWCVVYPPLCFVGAENGTTNIVYKSKLMEIIEDFRNRNR